MPKTSSFENVAAWQKAHAVTLQVYEETPEFPADERFGLTFQMRKAAVSVPANFAEGYGRWTKPDKAHFYSIAQGSLTELHYHQILARDLGYPVRPTLITDIVEVERILASYRRSLLRSMGG